MKIGIIGTGNMGRTLGTRWARAGHDVMFGARDREVAARAAANAGAQAGSLEAAAAFGDVLLYTVRGVPPSRILRAPLDGKIVIDCNNSDFDPASPTGFAPPPVPAYAEQLAADAPGARVVQAFSTIPHVVLELAPSAPISVFLCGDDDGAKQVVGELAAQLGLTPVDSGPLRAARIVDHVADFIRYHILRRDPYLTISLAPIAERPR